MKNKINLFSRNKIRLFVLVLSLFVINGHFYVKYYQGIQDVLKHIPLPVLNCYSTPSTVFSCPMGLIQHFFNIGFMTFATVGILLLFGALIGRWACGWLCPFGFFQEVLYHIPVKKFKLPKWSRYAKYLIFLLGIVILPMFLKNSIGIGETWFCNYCPAGCLEAGIPVPLMNPDLRYLIGTMYWVKLAILVFVVIIPSMFVKRPFCSTICPLGLFMGFTNSFSFLKLKYEAKECNSCGMCSKHCPMGLDPTKEYGSVECILCMNCTKEWCDAITPHYTNKYLKEKKGD